MLSCYVVPEHNKKAAQATKERSKSDIEMQLRNHLKARANFDGRNASSGSVKKAMKKQATAPSKQAPNPSSLRRFSVIIMQEFCATNTSPSEKVRNTLPLHSNVRSTSTVYIPLQ